MGDARDNVMGRAREMARNDSNPGIADCGATEDEAICFARLAFAPLRRRLASDGMAVS